MRPRKALLNKKTKSFCSLVVRLRFKVKGNPSVSIESGKLLLNNEVHTSICVITNIPEYMDIYDVLDLLEDFRDNIQFIRVLKTQNAKSYGVAVKLERSKMVDSLVKKLGGKRYSFMEENRIDVHKIRKYFQYQEIQDEILEAGQETTVVL